MTTSTFLTYALGFGVTVAALVIVRGLVAQLLVQAACRKARPAVEAFKAGCICVRPLPSENRKDATDLLNTIRIAQDFRSIAMAKMREVEIPVSANPKPFADLKFKIKEVESDYLGTVVEFYKIKLTLDMIGFVKDQAKSRFYEAYNVAGHTASHLSKLDQQIMEVLDKCGVIDLAEAGLDQMYRGIEQMFPQLKDSSYEAVRLNEINLHDGSIGEGSETINQAASDIIAESVGGIADAIVDIVSFPGIISGVKDLFRELDMLISDETSFEESLEYGFLPILTRSAWIALGAAADAAFGFTTLGLFTLAGVFASMYLNQRALLEKRDRLSSLYWQIVELIRHCQRIALERVNQAVAAFLTSFSDAVRRCPDVGDEPALTTFVMRLVAAYGDGLLQSNLAVVEKAKEHILVLPPKAFLDTILFIDRSREVEELYWDAVRTIQSTHTGVMARLAMAAESHPLDVVTFLLDEFTFHNPATSSLLSTVEEVVVDCARGYAKSITNWERDCAKVWNRGVQDVEAVAAREEAEVEAVVVQKTPELNRLSKRIRAMDRRLGIQNEEDPV
ncbi:MAG: hypothetical protein NTX13_04420 [Acidobacteria bacterium]|nr:hypothetical protein [Acidobacteriota bacterium]